MIGWIKLHRKITENPVFGSQVLLKIWVWLQCKASSTDRTITLKTGNGLSIVSLQVGQLVFGRRSAERELDIDESTVYKAMLKLQDLGEIKIDSNTRFSIVTLLNYVEDQQSEGPEDFEILDDVTSKKPRKNHDVTTKEPQSNHEVTQLNKVKNVKKVENLKNDFSPPAAGGNRVKKKKPEKNTETRKHWQPLIDCYNDFYKKNFNGEEPSFTGKQIKDFSKLYDLLQLRAKKKMVEWSESYAVGALNFYLGLAFSEEWLSKHFTLSNLVEQFDAVFAREATKKKGPAVVKFSDEIQYLVDRYSEGELDDRLLTAELYKKMEEKKLIPEGYREKFTAATPDMQKAMAIKTWLEANKKKTA